MLLDSFSILERIWFKPIKSGLFSVIERGAKKVSKALPTSFGSSPGQKYGFKRMNCTQQTEPLFTYWLGERVKVGEELATQAGLRFIPGPNVWAICLLIVQVTVGHDFTLHANVDGRLLFFKDTKSYRKIIAVIPEKKDKRIINYHSVPDGP